MRIITGSARGIKLETLEGEDITRPTPERVKEAVFSMLQFELEGKKMLDLFAGSGQNGLEALSRGAENCFFCDENEEAFEIIKRNAQKTKLYQKCRIHKNDYKALLRSLGGREKFDIIYLDPPFKSDFAADAIKRIAYLDILADDGIIIVETEKQEPMEAEGYENVKFAKYGRVCINILKKAV